MVINIEMKSNQIAELSLKVSLFHKFFLCVTYFYLHEDYCTLVCGTYVHISWKILDMNIQASNDCTTTYSIQPNYVLQGLNSNR